MNLLEPTRITRQETTPLNVKELASALGVSTNYVYQMRACGFEMKGLLRPNRKATLNAAKRWIRRMGFRVVDGRGRVGG